MKRPLCRALARALAIEATRAERARLMAERAALDARIEAVDVVLRVLTGRRPVLPRRPRP
jgi:hypothetical protein